MTDHSPRPVPAPHAGIFIDGENLSPRLWPAIEASLAGIGPLDLRRVYGCLDHVRGWSGIAGLRVIHTPTGSNAADMQLAIDATRFALERRLQRVVIVSSDGDFAPLAQTLREYGIEVIGLGEDKAPPGFRAACSRFRVLEEGTGPTETDHWIREIIRGNSQNGKGMKIADLNHTMRSRHDTRISEFPERTWRAYLARRPSLYDLDPRGPEAHVRFHPAGFRKG